MSESRWIISIILIIAVFAMVVMNLGFFFNPQRYPDLQILEVNRVNERILVIGMIYYCSASGCSGNSFHLRYTDTHWYGLSEASTEALKAATPSSFIAIGTTACLILSFISWVFNFATLGMKSPESDKLRRITAIVAAILGVLSFIAWLGLYIAFRISLNKVASSFKDVPDTNIKWGIAIPICWALFCFLSIVTLVPVWWKSKPRPEPAMNLGPVPSNAPPSYQQATGSSQVGTSGGKV